MPAKLGALIAWLMKLRPARVFFLYAAKNGPILASGLSLTALYSVFAGVYVGFAVLGLSIAANPSFREAVISTLSSSVPGLIDTGNGAGGAIKLDTLFETRVLGWSGIIALVVLLFTALGWFAAARSAVRAMFDLPPSSMFFLLLKLRDLALVLAFGMVTLLSAALSVFSTSALHFLFNLAGIGRSPFTLFSTTAVGLLLVLVIDTSVLAALFRAFLAVRIPLRRLITGSLIGGILLGVLKALGATIVSGAGKNPLLASFAIIIGLLLWFGLICQVILLSATWISVDLADHGQSAQNFIDKTGVSEPGRHPHPRVRPITRRR